MRGAAVQRKEDQQQRERPDEAARKRAAVELIRDHDQPLKWTARRYSICPEDAEDAYQRGIEILLEKAPSTDYRHLLPWTRKVIKHEALAVRRTRERTLPRPGHPDQAGELASGDWVQLIPAADDGPDELTVRREQVARSREALARLKPAELKALTQLAEGFSYQEIGAMNDWSRTKVNRCLTEGRARFRSRFSESEGGRLCPEFEPLISAGCDGELEPAQLSDLEHHLAVCGHCRSTLRTYRAAPRAAAALAPLLPAGTSLWERVQGLAVDLQLRLQGVGSGSDSGVQAALASGGSRGAGMAAIAKLAAICAGTAGTAAVCAATGVLPAPALLPDKDPKPAGQRVSAATPEPPREPMVFVPPQPEPAAEQKSSQPSPENTKPEPAEPDGGPVVSSSAPPPTPTESEFTPEAAGAPVPAAAAAAPPPPPAPSPVPVGNGGGEFAP